MLTSRCTSYKATCIKWGLKDQDLHFSVNIWSSDSRSKVGVVNIGMSVSTWGEKWDMSGSISSGSARQDRICRGQLRDTSQQCDECFNVSCFGPFLARQNEIEPSKNKIKHLIGGRYFISLINWKRISVSLDSLHLYTGWKWNCLLSVRCVEFGVWISILPGIYS